MLKKLLSVLFIGALTNSLFAISTCSDVQNLETFNGHYYGVSDRRMTFNEAKLFAEQKGGYLAIPNSAAENNFIKGVLGGNGIGWIGVYDPSFSTNYGEIQPNRFKDIKGSALSYSNWNYAEPNNVVLENDVIDGVQRISPLGEHWGVIDAITGLWAAEGNHFSRGEARHYAIMEFDSVPECYKDISTTVTDTFTNKRCSTQIWDNKTGNLETAVSNLDCQTDEFGNTYCPSAVAPCAQEWDYDDGFSAPGIGQVVDFVAGEIDYSSPPVLMQKGVKVEQAKNGLYYTEIVSNETTYGAQTTCASFGSGWRLPQGNETGAGAVPVGGQEYVIKDYSKYCSGEGMFATLSDCSKYSLSPAITNDWNSPRRNYRCVNTVPQNVKEGYIVIQGYSINKAGNGLYYTNVFPGKVPTGARDFCASLGGEWRLPQGCETTGVGAVPVGGQEYVYTDSCACNTGYTLSTKSNCKGYRFGWGDVRQFRCVATNPSNVVHNLKCPSGYTETNGTETAKGQCKKTLEYTYYNYLCSPDKNSQGFGWETINSGGNCNKTDPSSTANNLSTLDDACNSATPPKNNCKREKFMCQANRDRPCSFINEQWQCSPFPCFGNDDIEVEGDIEGKNDKKDNGWNSDGSCGGQLYIFNGEDYRCRSSDTFFGLTGGGCCDKDKVFMGLVSCKTNEKKLAEKAKKELCVQLGEYCSKKIRLGLKSICVQKSKGNCCFGSKLARVIHEQGRPQLPLGWGSGDSPICRGFTIDEFQKLDFSKIDLSNAIDISNMDINKGNNRVDSAIENIKNMYGGNNE